MRNSDTLLVGFDHSQGDIAVQIIDQFQGKEAEELYKKLVEKGGAQNG